MKLDQHCLAAMLVRAKCHIEAKEWDQAVRIMERMNSRDRHNQQSKKKAGEAALKAGNHEEAHRCGGHGHGLGLCLYLWSWS